MCGRSILDSDAARRRREAAYGRGARCTGLARVVRVALSTGWPHSEGRAGAMAGQRGRAAEWRE